MTLTPFERWQTNGKINQINNTHFHRILLFSKSHLESLLGVSFLFQKTNIKRMFLVSNCCSLRLPESLKNTKHTQKLYYKYRASATFSSKFPYVDRSDERQTTASWTKEIRTWICVHYVFSTATETDISCQIIQTATWTFHREIGNDVLSREYVYMDQLNIQEWITNIERNVKSQYCSSVTYKSPLKQ